jgi:hypothetical protein
MSIRARRPRPTPPAALVAALLCSALPPGPARPAAPDAGAAAFLGQIEAAWQAGSFPSLPRLARE